jgi:hypothetical protein
MTKTIVTHTPGPWAIDTAERGQSGTRFRSVYRAGNVHAEICRVYGGMRDQHMDADARLIAAAPDLLAACKSMLAHMESWRVAETSDGDMARSRAALAKAGAL